MVYSRGCRSFGKHVGDARPYLSTSQFDAISAALGEGDKNPKTLPEVASEAVPGFFSQVPLTNPPCARLMNQLFR